MPSLLRSLPKSGGWMNSIKVVMGLIEIGAAVKFLSVADFAWNPQPVVFDFVTVMLMWMLLSLAIGAYLLGWYRFVHDTKMDSISFLRWSLAMWFLGFGGLLGYLIIHPDRAAGALMNQVIAFAPPQVNAADTDVGPTVEHEGLPGLRFALDLNRAIPVAQKLELPLFLDFTGINCINCRRMEKKMAEPQNRRLIEQFLAVQLYADKVPAITDAQVAEQLRLRNIRLQTHWFGDVTLPSYAVVTPDGKTVLAMHIGYDAAGREFTQFLETGLQKWQAAKLAAAGKHGAVVAGR
jgi:thiol:disulfide interchange protein DsbD